MSSARRWSAGAAGHMASALYGGFRTIGGLGRGSALAQPSRGADRRHFTVREDVRATIL